METPLPLSTVFCRPLIPFSNNRHHCRTICFYVVGSHPPFLFSRGAAFDFLTLDDCTPLSLSPPKKNEKFITVLLLKKKKGKDIFYFLFSPFNYILVQRTMVQVVAIKKRSGKTEN